MEAIGPDEVDEEELKRAKTWRDIRAELTRGVKPSWSGKSARNTREWKASLEQKLAQKIVPGAVNGLLLAVYDASVDETAAGLLRLRVLKSGAAEEREARPDPMKLLAGDGAGAFSKIKRERATQAITPEDLEAHKQLVQALAALVTLAVNESV